MGHRRSPQVDSDLDGIWLHCATEAGSIELADRTINRITDQFNLLNLHPYLGRTRDEDFGPGLQSLLAGEYVIVYCIEEGDVLILRVVHGRRDLKSLFELEG